MAVYIALLRGINVGGNQKIKMSDLKRTFENLGMTRVRTYINSGNVVFEAEEGELALRRHLEEGIQTDYGMSITVVLRTTEELDRIMAACPFPADSLAEGESIQLTLLTEEPTAKQLGILSGSDNGGDEYHVQGQDIYLYFRQGLLESPLGKKLQKLGPTTTTRNWNTIKKLAALANE